MDTTVSDLYNAHMITYWSLSIFFAIADALVEKMGLIRIFKVQGKRLEQQGGFDWEKYRKTAIASLGNQYFVTLPFMYMAAMGLEWRGVGTSPITTLELEFWWKFAIILLVEDFAFYAVHYLLHTRWLYQNIHKIHHRWPMPVGCRALYAHPIEHLLGNLLPVFLGPFLVGLPVANIIQWIILTSATTVIVHSGYGITHAHDDHHKYYNVNYGALGVADYLFGTNYPLGSVYW